MSFSRSRCLLLSGVASSLFFAGCTQTYVQPYSGRAPLPAPYPYQQPPPPPAPPPVQSNQPNPFVPAEQDAYSRRVLAPALTTVKARIAAYEQKLQAWQDLERRKDELNLTPEQTESLLTCRNKVADLHEVYTRLQVRLLHERSEAAARELMVSSLQEFKERDIAYLEGECPPLFVQLNAPAKSNASQAEEADQAPADETAEQEQALGVPPAVLRAAENRPDLAVQYNEAAALVKKGSEQEARQAFADLLAAVRSQGKNRQLELKTLRSLAELEFGLKDYAAARKSYQELELVDGGNGIRPELTALAAAGAHKDELDAYASLLLACLLYRPDQDGFTVVQQAEEFARLYPSSGLNANAAELGRGIGQKAEQWFVGLLAQADQLAAEQKQQEALNMLNQVPLDILPLDKQDALRAKKDALAGPPAATEEPAALFKPDQPAPVLAEAQQSAVPVPDEKQDSGTEAEQNGPDKQESSKPNGPPPVTALQETWDEGLNALQAGDYDKAIEIFSSLQNTSFAEQAARKRGEAISLAAHELRKQAARLFLRAGNATAPEAKRELLLSSKALLEDILRKYPQPDLEDKIKRNLQRVDEELAGLGNAGAGGGQQLGPLEEAAP